MKVLQIYRFSPRKSIGGVLSFMTLLAKNIEFLGVETTIASIAKNPIDENDVEHGFKLKEFKETFSILGIPFSTDLIKKFTKLSDDFDVIHFHSPCVLSLITSFFVRKKPYLVTYHADITTFPIVYFFYKFFERSFLRRAKLIIVTSPQYKESSKPLKSFKAKVKVVTIGVEEPTTKRKVSPFQIRKMSSTTSQFFLFLGANRKYKGLGTLLKVALRSPNINFVFAGPGTENLLTEERRENVKNISLLGAVSEAEKFCLLENCDGLILPSNSRGEALGLSLIEASMFGKPLISCEIETGTSFVNLHNVTGLVVSANSVNALKGAVLALHNDKKLRKRLGDGALKNFKDNFTVLSMASQYLEIYGQLKSDADQN